MTKLLTTSAYNKLLNEIVTLYPLLNDIQRIMVAAGLVVGEANLQGAGKNMWDSVLSLAEKKDKLGPLITALLQDFDQRPVLLEIRQAMNDGSAFIKELEWSEFITVREGSKANIYLIYDQQDFELVGKLKGHLNVYVLNEVMEVVDMHGSVGGQDIQTTRLKGLERADIVLLLLTRSFFGSENGCMQLAFTAFGMRKPVVPALLSNCLYNRIRVLAEIVPLPKNGVFVNQWDSVDEALMVIAEGVEEIAQKLIK